MPLKTVVRVFRSPLDYTFPKYVLALYFPEKRSWTTFFRNMFSRCIFRKNVRGLWYRMEGCHLVLIISLMSGNAVGACGSHKERSLIFFLYIQVLML